MLKGSRYIYFLSLLCWLSQSRIAGGSSFFQSVYLDERACIWMSALSSLAVYLTRGVGRLSGGLGRWWRGSPGLALGNLGLGAHIVARWHIHYLTLLDLGALLYPSSHKISRSFWPDDNSPPPPHFSPLKTYLLPPGKIWPKISLGHPPPLFLNNRHFFSTETTYF